MARSAESTTSTVTPATEFWWGPTESPEAPAPAVSAVVSRNSRSGAAPTFPDPAPTWQPSQLWLKVKAAQRPGEAKARTASRGTHEAFGVGVTPTPQLQWRGFTLNSPKPSSMNVLLEMWMFLSVCQWFLPKSSYVLMSRIVLTLRSAHSFQSSSETNFKDKMCLFVPSNSSTPVPLIKTELINTLGLTVVWECPILLF